ncbi:MAG TPA: hypothetical protein VGO47_01895 [Chlamydiales bacterium]|jgi:hypothetical protein|nr:hypothetical protein [Chlamydiales bacterium]
MSKRFGSCTSCSDVAWRYCKRDGSPEKYGSDEACEEAMAILDSDASTPTVRAPSLAKL